MANTPGVADHAAPEPVPARTVGISPKALWATVWAFVAPLLGTGLDALLAYVLDNPSIFAALPPVVQAPLLAVLGALGAAVAAWKSSPGTITRQSPS